MFKSLSEELQREMSVALLFGKNRRWDCFPRRDLDRTTVPPEVAGCGLKIQFATISES